MPALFGEFPLRADAKGRFLLPAALLRQLPEGDQFVINRGLDPCLVLYPMPVWQAELERLYRRNPYDADSRTFARLFQSGAQPVALDASHRLLIPKPLWEGIMAEAPTQDLVLIGSFDRIEIWAEPRYQRWLADERPRLLALSDKIAEASTPSPASSPSPASTPLA